jgi:hypothetical protein
MLVGTAAFWFIRDLIVDKDQRGRDLLRWIFVQALASRSITVWLIQIIKRIINIVYGESIFRIASDG